MQVFFSPLLIRCASILILWTLTSALFCKRAFPVYSGCIHNAQHDITELSPPPCNEECWALSPQPRLHLRIPLSCQLPPDEEIHLFICGIYAIFGGFSSVASGLLFSKEIRHAISDNQKVHSLLLVSVLIFLMISGNVNGSSSTMKFHIVWWILSQQ